MENIFSTAALLYNQNFGFSIIPERDKIPLVEWSEFQTGQTIEQLKSLSFNNDCTGLGVILNNDVRCFDIDKCSDIKFVKELISSLGFPGDYEWIVKSGSGYHIYFICEDFEYFYKTYGNKSSYTFQLKKTYLENAKRLELKWKNCKVTLPPSKHKNGSLYSFVNNDPSQSPKGLRGTGELLKIIERFCDIEYPPSKTSGKNIQQKETDKFNSFFEEIINEGSRTISLISLAGKYKSLGMSGSLAINNLLLWNRSNLNPPLEEIEICKTVKDIYKRYSKEGLFKMQTGNHWIEQAKARPIPKMLFGEFWFEGELCILFADTNLGKSILAVQIANSCSEGKQINKTFKFEAQKQSILYFDFELSDKQFQARYSNNFQQNYIFDTNFLRAEINPDNADYRVNGFESFEKYLYDSFEKSIISSGSKIIIIDNITYLKDETERSKFALPLMKYLQSLKKKTWPFNL